MNKHIVIIGGGLAGTAAAYHVTKRGYRATIIEKDDRLGGRINTHMIEGAALETGACFLTKEYKNLLAFLDETKLAAHLSEQHGTAGILKQGVVRMATIKTLLGNNTLSWRTKLQLMPLTVAAIKGWRRLELHSPWRADVYDNHSVAEMLGKPNQKELLEYLIQPALNGYLYWTPEHTSRAALLMMWRTAIAQGSARFKLRNGLQRIPEKAAQGSQVMLGCLVNQVKQAKNGSYEISVTDEMGAHAILADGIVCATTASVVPNIFPSLTNKQRAFFEAVEYSSTVVVSQTYNKDQARKDKSIAFPRLEGTGISAVTLSSDFNSERVVNAPPVSILNTYASGVIGRELCDLSDEAVVARLSTEMEPMRNTFLVGNPKSLQTHVQRWPEALPFFGVGHFKRLRAFEDGEIEDQNQMITFAGDYIGGPCMESAFTSGMRAAERLDLMLKDYVQG